MRGKKEGMQVGFICGILMDVFWGGLLGFYALIYTTAGYVNGFFKRMFYDEDIKLPLGMIAASELVYGLVVYFCLLCCRENSISSITFSILFCLN